MSDVEEEYEVEVIQRAKVEQDQRGRKTWKYYVKWKGYGQDANTWEPVTSFEGSEHFVENFWNRVRTERDHTQMKLFKAGEEVFPVGPPGKMKIKKSEPAPRKDQPQSPRRPTKRKETDSEVEVQSIIEEDSEEPVSTRRSARKRRASDIEPAGEAPTKRRRSRAPIRPESDEEEDKILPPPLTSGRRASTSRARAAPKKVDATSSRTTRALASPSKPPAKSRSTVRARPKASSKPSEEVIEIDSDSDEPAAPPEEEPVSKPSSSIAYVEVPPSPAKTNGSPKKAAANTRRGVKQSASQDNDAAASESDSPQAVTPRVTRKLKRASSVAAGLSTRQANGKQDLSPSRRPVRGSKAGPGRSSKGIVTASASGSTSRPGPGRSSKGIVTGSAPSLIATPGDGPKTMRKRGATPKPGKAKQAIPAVDPDAMEVDDAIDDPLLAPLTNEDLDHLAKLTQTPAPEPAGDVSNYEGTSERDADGESDHDLVDHHQSPKLSPKMKRGKALAGTSKAEAHNEVGQETKQEHKPQPVEETSKEIELAQAPKQVIINPPDTAIGGNLERRSSFASSWKPPTIFDNISSSSFRRPADPPAVSSEPSSSVLSISITPSVKVSVLLEDIDPPTDSGRKRLDEVVTHEQAGPPGKFYKGQAAQDMLKALGFGGSCAKAVPKPGADDSEKESFERFHSYLKDDNLFIAMAGSVILTFCSSKNGDTAMKLGISPNLVGLGDNILVSEVVIADDAAYCDAVVNIEDVRW